TLTFNVSKDIRDNVFYPEFGYYTYSAIETTGGFLKGSDEYHRYVVDFRNFEKYSSKFVIAARVKYGKIDVREGTLEDYEKFHLGGGGTIRGYKNREYTGQEELLGNIEFRYEINDNMKVYAFMDKGNLDFDSSNGSGEKTGYGLGLLFKTPMGMLRLDWGRPDEDGRGSESYFNFGTMF
ncbi:MAG: BamA/TamA family outer membrane protein, partial [Candidatus Muiribacteriaceae bacterium]